MSIHNGDQFWNNRALHLGYTIAIFGKILGLQTFDDYLAVFNANQRRNIKRERKAVSKAGLRLQPLTGDAITPSLLSLMYEFYADTCDKFGWWGSKYLTKEFFQQLAH